MAIISVKDNESSRWMRKINKKKTKIKTKTDSKTSKHRRKRSGIGTESRVKG